MPASGSGKKSTNESGMVAGVAGRPYSQPTYSLENDDQHPRLEGRVFRLARIEGDRFYVR